MSAIAIIYRDSSAAASMMRIIASAGMLAETYSTVAEFLSDDGRDAFNCLVIDSELLHEGESKTLLERHRDQSPGGLLPVLVLSRTDDPIARRLARKFGAAAFFHEPVDGEALLDAIRWEFSHGADE